MMTLDNKPLNSLPVSLSPRHPVNLKQQIKYLAAYWREYRTYFHIGQSWGVDSSTVCRIVHL